MRRTKGNDNLPGIYQGEIHETHTIFKMPGQYGFCFSVQLLGWLLLPDKVKLAFCLIGNLSLDVLKDTTQGSKVQYHDASHRMVQRPDHADRDVNELQNASSAWNLKRKL
jgi:hypothetical protein